MKAEKLVNFYVFKMQKEHFYRECIFINIMDVFVKSLS